MKKRLIYILAAVVILCGGFVLGFNYDSIANQSKSSINNKDNTKDNDNISVSGSTLSSNCIVEYITTYEDAGENVKIQENLDVSLVGKNRDEIEQYFKNWKLEFFSKDKITLSRIVSGYPKGYAIVKVMLNKEDLSTGETCVYEYNGEGDMILRNTIDEVPQLIDANELKGLLEGKVFSSLDAAYAYLENILD